VPGVVVSRAQTHPAFVSLAGDKGLAGLALRLQRIEFLVEPLLGGFAGVNRTTDGPAPPRRCRFGQPFASARREPPPRVVTPKHRGPDQGVPVIRLAITVRER